jgi:hypothetical protein
MAEKVITEQTQVLTIWLLSAAAAAEQVVLETAQPIVVVREVAELGIQVIKLLVVEVHSQVNQDGVGFMDLDIRGILQAATVVVVVAQVVSAAHGNRTGTMAVLADMIVLLAHK